MESKSGLTYQEALQQRQRTDAAIHEIVLSCTRRKVPLRKMGKFLLLNGRLPPSGGLQWVPSQLARLAKAVRKPTPSAVKVME